ncbi:MAG: transglutaminase domain-containing protein [bacterium]
MKQSLLLTLLFIVSATSIATTAVAAPGCLLASFATPGPAPTGLAFDGESLWLADRLTDTLYAIDPESGAVRRELPAPGFMPRGLTWDGKYLWCVDGEEGRIVQLDVTSGLTLKSLESPTEQPQGITWDGANLWLADAGEDVLCQISPDDGTVIERFAAPLGNPTGLTWWEGYLWCADRRADKIFLVDPRHRGEVVFGVDAPGLHANGLACDGKRLWNADYQDDAIHCLVLDDGETIQTTDPHRLHLALIQEFRNYGPGEVTQLDLYLAIPRERPGQTFLGEVTFDPAPTAILEDRWQQPVAHFRLAELPLAERQRVTMTVDVELSAWQQFVFPHRVGSLDDIPKDVRQAYLVDEDKYRIHDPRIQQAVQQALGGERNPYWMMRNIHRYIRERMYYELSGGWNVAPRVIERGNGSCSEYTFVFIAMCRAAGIPARYVGAVVIRGDEASYDDVFHRWSQVYLPSYGWVHVDPQGGDRETPAEVAESIGNLSNRFLITTEGGGASEYLGWGYNHGESWIARGPVKVHMEAVGEWSPLAESTAPVTAPAASGACAE